MSSHESSQQVPEPQGRTAGEAGSVVVLSGDLFFGMRIRTVLRHAGYDVVLSGDVAAFRVNLQRQDACTVLGIVDFNAGVDWTALEPALASGVPVIAFGAHTDVDGFRAAKSAGVARVVSNGEFSRALPELARRYARSLNDPTT